MAASVEHRCSCGAVTRYAVGQSANCSGCGRALSNMDFSQCSMPRTKSTADMEPGDFHPLDLQEHLAAKAYYESPEIARKILSGEIGLREKGPKFLRPVCPESERKHYH